MTTTIIGLMITSAQAKIVTLSCWAGSNNVYVIDTDNETVRGVGPNFVQPYFFSDVHISDEEITFGLDNDFEYEHITIDRTTGVLNVHHFFTNKAMREVNAPYRRTTTCRAVQNEVF
jgi:hypothetical protein